MRCKKNFGPVALTAIFLSLLGASCRRPQWPDIILSPYFDRLLKLETDLARQPVEYEDYNRRERFRPEGLFSDGKDIFVWSSRHREQAVLAENGGQWQVTRRRSGPLKTRRCLFIREQNIGSVCLGAMQPQGLIAFDKTMDFELEHRAGYEDFAWASGRFFVADYLKGEIIILDDRGKFTGRIAAPGIYRVIVAEKRLIYLSYLNPRLVILAETPEKWAPVAEVALAAPVRDLWFEAAHARLWAVGPKNEVVKRKTGGIDNLNSFLYSYALSDLMTGKATPELAVDLGKHGLVDALSLTPSPQGLLVSARGSSRFAHVFKHGGVEIFETGLAGVSALFTRGENILATGIFSDTVKIFSARANPPQHVALNARVAPPLTPREQGELIFFSRGIGSDLPQNQFSCESCHWDRLTDHRIHYGGGGTQGLIRPARGIGMVSHPMPDMEYDSIAKLVEEFFKAMDYKFWSEPQLPETHWQKEKILYPEADTPVKLSAQDARVALLTYLMRLPAESPLLRSPGKEFSTEARRGFDIFWRDCIRCHEPVMNMRTRKKLDKAEALAHLKHNPLVFGAPLFTKTAVPHAYTAHGTRINPLTNLGRGGPYLTRGAAQTLADILRRTNPKTNEVHFADNSAVFYSPAEIAALTAFLLAI